MVTVRAGAPPDAEAITRVHVTGWQWAYDGLMPAGYLAAMDPADPQRVATRRRHLEQPSETHTLVAVTESGEVVGFANVGQYRDNQQRDDVLDVAGEVYAIYVRPDLAGTGIGRALMDEAVAVLRGRGLEPIRLWVLQGNARALAFYERYGFRLDGGRSKITIEQPGELPVELPEVRLTLDGTLAAGNTAG